MNHRFEFNSHITIEYNEDISGFLIHAQREMNLLKGLNQINVNEVLAALELTHTAEEVIIENPYEEDTEEPEDDDEDHDKDELNDVDDTVFETGDVKLDFQSSYELMKQHVGNEGKFQAKCSGKCKEAFLKCWHLEYQTMNFMLRYIAESLIYVKEGFLTIQILQWDVKWKKAKFTLQFPQQPRRIVIGMGPSGCGKSTVSIPFLIENGHTHVMAIDGGGARSASISWALLKITNPQGISNMYNLMFPKFFGHKHLFKKQDIKKRLFQILNATERNPYNVKNAEKWSTNCTIYVADTLSRNKGVSKYIEMDPHWAALFIWQHKNCVDKPCNLVKSCPYPVDLKCIGCDVSGFKRSLTEGKIYSSSMYDTSNRNSYSLMLKAPVKAMIHNSGSAKTSVYVSTHEAETEKMGKTYAVNGKNVKFKVVVVPAFPARLEDCFTLIEKSLKSGCGRRIWSRTFRSLRGGNMTRKL